MQLQGCDASVMVASTANNTAEKDHPINLSLAGDGFDTVIRARAAVDAAPGCRGKVSCADILAMATRDAIALVRTTVYVRYTTSGQLQAKASDIMETESVRACVCILQSGGPSYAVELGRLDGLRSTASSVNGRLPAPFFNLDQLNQMFAANGLSQTDMVALSGTFSGLASYSSILNSSHALHDLNHQCSGLCSQMTTSTFLNLKKLRLPCLLAHAWQLIRQPHPCTQPSPLPSAMPKSSSSHMIQSPNHTSVSGSGNLQIVRLSSKPYFFCQPAIFFSHNKSANNTFSHDFSEQRTEIAHLLHYGRSWAHGGSGALQHVRGAAAGGGRDAGRRVRGAAGGVVPGGGGSAGGGGHGPRDAGELRQPVLPEPAGREGTAGVGPGAAHGHQVQTHRRRAGTESRRVRPSLRRRHHQAGPRRGQDGDGTGQRPPRLRRARLRIELFLVRMPSSTSATSLYSSIGFFRHGEKKGE